jgi:hypothetical protein
MFEYLPVVSFEDGFEMVKKDVPYFEGVVQKCVQQTKKGKDVMAPEVIYCACHELSQRNPLLGTAVMAHVMALATVSMDDVGAQRAWIDSLAALAGELAILRLVDRALEAEKGEKKEGVRMFEYLPVVSEADAKVNAEKDLPYFRALMRQCMKRTDIGSEVVEYACDELTEHSPGLGVAVEGYAEAMARGLEGDVGSRVAWADALGAAAGVLTILRLIDRALEAKAVGEKH